MTRARIVICEFMDEGAVARLAAAHDVLYDPKLVGDAARLRAEAAGADALVVRNLTQVRGDLLAAMARCKVVGRLGVGLDNIDVPACEARGIKVIPATGANALSVAEYVIASTLLLLRGAFASTGAVATGQWPRAALGNGRETAGQTLGIVGFGSIGQTTARLAHGLGMRVIAHDAMLPRDAPVFAQSGVQPVSLDELVRSADVVTLHIPLLDTTRGLFNAARIGAMKKGAVLINTSRGHIVDINALTAALRTGQLGGAAIDVFDVEPLPVSPSLQDCPNLLLTPHISGVSAQSNERVSVMIAIKVLESFL
ncbi:hydroxyacid dehydrogenase [Polaromonas sp.]|uniref:hydroxyacid dehydrogenase n=1 Tax=Polaromonas sp. TaxID=1869339 RepID=UPI0032633CA4